MTDITDSSLVTPGQFITSEKSFLRGHGSFILDNSEGYQLLSCVAGQIERIDKLITVKAVKSRCDRLGNHRRCAIKLSVAFFYLCIDLTHSIPSNQYF